MAYTKQTWATGDIVTQEKMNHIEDGIAANDTAIGTTNTAITAAGPMILTFPTTPTTSDNGIDYYEETHGYTWQNVMDALTAGRTVRYVITVQGVTYYSQPNISFVYDSGGEDFTGYTHFIGLLADDSLSLSLYATSSSGVITRIEGSGVASY